MEGSNMSRGGCLAEIIILMLIAAALLYVAAQLNAPTQPPPGTLDPVLNHEAYP
jgi:hypothetical protein